MTGLHSPHISADEFPPGVIEQMDPRILAALSDLRNEVGLPLYPSPVYGAHIRERGTSRHSVEGGRLSDATDFFCRWDAAWKYLDAARRHPDIGGIGIYTHTIYRAALPGDWAMMHIDLRPDTLEWVCHQRPGIYVYLQSEPLKYHRILGEFARV